jgi:hypothetical protein
MGESAEQCALFQWAAVWAKSRPELGMLFAIPNGGARSKATAGRLKAEGVKAGVPDICLPVRRSPYGALWIEMKRPKSAGRRKGELSEPQKEWLGDLQAAGHCVAVCYGAAEAIATIDAYLRGDAHSAATCE